MWEDAVFQVWFQNVNIIKNPGAQLCFGFFHKGLQDTNFKVLACKDELIIAFLNVNMFGIYCGIK